MTDTLAHTHTRPEPEPWARSRSRPRRRCSSLDHGSRAATAASPRRAAPDFERGGPRPAGMGKRAGGAAGTAAASTSPGAGLEPAAGRGGGPRSAAAGLLGALHLVMTLVVAAARAEKEGGCHRPASPLPRAVTAPSRRPLWAATGRQGRGVRLRPPKVAGSSHVRNGEFAVRMPARGVGSTELLLLSVISSPCRPPCLLSLPIQNFLTSRIFLPLGPLLGGGGDIFLDLIAVNRQILQDSFFSWLRI